MKLNKVTQKRKLDALPQGSIDLHIHSKNSDGTKDTAELLACMREVGLEIASFTDHDSVACYQDLLRIQEDGLEDLLLVTGVELSFIYYGELKDMLGYGIDIPKVSAFLAERYSKEKRLQKERTVLGRFKEICREKQLVFDESIEAISGNKSEAFNLMYNALIKHQENIEKFPFIADNAAFYRQYFSNRASDFFVDETVGLPSMQEVLRLIHDAGGLAFLAHPLAYRMPRDKTEALIRDAIKAGIDGIEVQHSSNAGDDVETLNRVAKENGLYVSGGSDFHGDTKPTFKLGRGRDNICVRYEEIREWFECTTVFHLE